ncbi:hypothetical protein JCM10212_006938 [Sporobolomyces blumeae]
MRNITLTLHRSDLRLHDNVLISKAHDQKSDATHVLPIYVFDERFIELSGFPGYEREGPPAKTRVCGFWRTSAFRSRFVNEGVFDLRKSLRARGSDLLVRFGKLENVVDAVIKQLKDNGDNVKNVYFQKEFYSEELAIERALKKKLDAHKVPLVFFDQAPLVHVDELPFPIAETPDVFTPFRKRIEGLEKLGRDPLPVPTNFKPFPKLKDAAYTGYGSEYDETTEPQDILRYFLRPLREPNDATEISNDANEAPHHESTAFPYNGGETSAIERLEWYFKDGDHPPVAKYKQTRNGLLGHSYSTKLSPFLAHGMVSPRLVMQYLAEHEERFTQTQNTYWVQFELLWRDYFFYTARKFGNNIFLLGGLEAVTDPKQAKGKENWWKYWNPEHDGPDHPATRWMEARTGVPFIDANMAELKKTGFMSNRGRQNVASFLTKDLQVDWRVGAEFFESHLLDHEPSSNYGNWTYVAGVGNDPRATRQFNCVKQSRDYQPDGSYVRTWLPQLEKVPSEYIHAPWAMPTSEKGKYYDEKDYPTKPVIEQSSWKPHYHRKKGPNKCGVANRNERVKNPGPGGPKKHKGAAANGGNAEHGEHAGHGGHGGHGGQGKSHGGGHGDKEHK